MVETTKSYLVEQYDTPNEMQDAINIIIKNNYVPFAIFFAKGYYTVVYKKIM